MTLSVRTIKKTQFYLPGGSIRFAWKVHKCNVAEFDKSAPLVPWPSLAAPLINISILKRKMDKGNYAGHAWAAAYTHGGCGHAFHDHLPPRDFSPRTASTHYAPPAHVADVRSWALTHAFLSPEIPTNFSSATVPSGSSPARERERERERGGKKSSCLMRPDRDPELRNPRFRNAILDVSLRLG